MSSSPDFPIRFFDRAVSTNDSILAAGEAGEPEGTTHIARTQTGGRGRIRRAWWSPPNAGLWMSTLLRPESQRAAWGGLAILAGVATRAALTELGVKKVEVFWPNDLEVGGRKLGGILCEVREKGPAAWIAIGIGVNIDLTSTAVRNAMPEELRGKITCMTAEGPPTTKEPGDIARGVLREFWPFYERFLSGESTARAAEAELAHLGGEVSVRLPNNTAFSGVAAGLGRGGELLVRDARDGEIKTVVAGDVTYIK